MSSLLKTNMKIVHNKLPQIAPKKVVSKRKQLKGMNVIDTFKDIKPKITIKKKLVINNVKYLPIQAKMVTKFKESGKLKNLLQIQNDTQIVNNKIDKTLGNDHASKIIEKIRQARLSENHIRNMSENQTKKKNIKRKLVSQAKKIDKEYYPDKVHRTVSMKKVMLLPKHQYRVVATTNKRKRTIPVKEIEPLIPAVKQMPELSVPEMVCPANAPAVKQESELTLPDLVRLAEEQGLDDEDFMEILTCPSPVWWEEWSDDEEELRFRLRDVAVAPKTEEQNTLIEELVHKTQNNAEENKITVINKSEKNNNSFSKKFIDKRKKLENLLNNIKSKSNDNHGTILKQSEKYKNSSQMNVFDEPNVQSNKKDRKESISGLSDVSITDELINTLENMEIPIKETNNSINSENELNKQEKVESEIIPIDTKVVKRRKKNTNNDVKVVNNYEFIRKRTRKPNRKYEIDWSPEKKTRVKNETKVNNDIKGSKSSSSNSKNISKHKEQNLINPKNNVKEINDKVKSVGSKNIAKALDDFRMIKVKKVSEINSSSDVKFNTVPPDLPPLKKNPFKNKPKVYASPKSIVILNSESNLEPDSISDTNIKFLDEYNDKTSPEEEVNVNKYAKDADGELVTVYQILTNNPTDDIESQIKVNLVNKSLQPEVSKTNGQINDFFKTKKIVKKNKK